MSCSAEIRRDYRRVLIVIEGVYSMDGDFPELPPIHRGRKSGTKRC